MGKSQQDRFGESWTRNELILAFDLYCRIPFKQTKASNSQVRQLAAVLGRSPAAVARKLGNFGAFDPQLRGQGISGLTHGSRLDKQVWDEFHHDWGKLVYHAFKLKQFLAKSGQHAAFTVPSGESERMVLSKQRIHQAFFRDTVLSNYDYTCCITGLRLAECLIASHIVPWSQAPEYRVDPTNGICLSATFDRLFDVGLITISPDFHVCIADRLRKVKDEVVGHLVHIYDGRPIIRPNRFLPAIEHLQWHRDNVFTNN